MKHTLKKIIYIALLTVFFIVVFLQNNVIAASSNSNNNTYTIEDIVYNRIPIFDINVFSNTAGGQDIVNNSAVSTIRTIVATWYVSIRNVVAVLLGILLVYTGLRMAISTVASDKAKYKEYLLGWLKSIIILFTINYIMIIILNINDMLVNMFSRGSSSESLMYETIRTRAHDFSRPTIEIPAMFMYIALIFILVRFVWIYAKRTFTVLILIVLAPIISAKYAFDSATGKKSRVFSEWLYQFSANVLLQSVHALLYTSIVGISLDMSTENITGYIISLIFLNFMLSADKIILKIFKFDGHVEDVEKPFKKEENLEGVYYTYGAMKLAQRGTKYVGHKLKVMSYSPALRGIRSSTSNVKNRVFNSLDDAILSLSNKAGQKLATNGIINKKINSMNRNLILKKASRRKGSAGRVAKQTLKLKKEQKKTVFKGNYKFIKNDVKGVGSIVLAIPVMVVNPAVGIGLFFSGKNNLKENSRAQRNRKYSTIEKIANTVTFGQYINRTEQHNFNEKRNKKIDDTMKTMLEVNNTMDKIEQEIGKYDDSTKTEAKSVMKAHYMSDVDRVGNYMKGYMADVGNINMDVANIDENTKNEMINYVIGVIGRGSKLDENQKNIIIRQTKIDLRNNRYDTDRDKNNIKFATTIMDSVRSNINKNNRFTNEINLVNELEENNKKLFASLYNTTEDETTQVIDIENYIDTL